MTHSDLLSDFDFPPGDRRADLLLIRLFCLYLADHVHPLRDATDFRQFLLHLGEEARKVAKVSAPELSLRQELTPVAKPTPRYDPTCPRCGHVHEGASECGMFMGNGRFCRCEMEGVA